MACDIVDIEMRRSTSLRELAMQTTTKLPNLRSVQTLEMMRRTVELLPLREHTKKACFGSAKHSIARHACQPFPSRPRPVCCAF